MAKFSANPEAFGKPGIDPRWSHSNKDAIGTAYSADSKIWFTIWKGIVTEVYYPTVDRPQLRDLEFLITDGKTFFNEEKRHFQSKVEAISLNALGYNITSTDPQGRYKITKQVITNPHLPCLLQKVHIESDNEFLKEIQLFVLCAPHLEMGGKGNNAYVVEAAGAKILAAEKNGTWLALSSSAPFKRMSCGYVGRSDGWTDIYENFKMDYEFGKALNGNVALTGEVDISNTPEFVLGLAFGNSLPNAVSTLLQSLGQPFDLLLARYTEQWDRAFDKVLPLASFCAERNPMYHGSYSILLAHEDKTYPGAIIASLTIPWGEVASDDNRGGYHLVWTRDLVKTVTGMLAAGNTETPLRTLIYLAASQKDDGSFPQNFWVNGEAYWGGLQLDEVAYPIVLAWRLWKTGALRNFDPYPMIIGAASFLLLMGPATAQERWEEASGYSPSTLASNITGLICAAEFARFRGDEDSARYMEEYADFLESHIETWTVTTEGVLVPEIRRHYIRICPIDIANPEPEENPNTGLLTIVNRLPGAISTFPAKEIVDAGFLELVRYGIRSPNDQLILDSLKVVDTVLKVETPFGPCWRRYNNDGYGQRPDGEPFQGWGKGRAWPLLTAERAHYELTAGRDITHFIRALEKFASSTCLIPEQIWDEKDMPEEYLHLGGPTGSAMPLVWAQAEYIKLLRSVSDQKLFDTIPAVSSRYLGNRTSRKKLEIWKPNRRIRTVKKGTTLRLQMPYPFRLHWTDNDWTTINDSDSSSTKLGIEFVDMLVDSAQRIRFTFFYPERNQWEGRDFSITVT